MSDPRIRAAFESRLEAWAADQDPVLTVVYQNTTSDPIEGTYVRCWLLQAPDGSRGIDGTHREYSGIFQVDLCMPIGEGAGAATLLSQSLDDEFDVSTPITQAGLKIWITSPTTEGPAMQEETHFVVPVSCRYTAHLFKT